MSEFLTSEADMSPLKELPSKESFTSQAWPITPPTLSRVERRFREMHVHHRLVLSFCQMLFSGCYPTSGICP